MEASLPTDSNGNYSLPPGYLAVTGQTVLASQHNPPLEDLGVSMTNRLPRNGSAGMTANLNLGGYKGVNAGAATDPTDVITLAQVQALIAAVSGAITGELKAMTGSAVPTGYLLANGQSVSRTTYAALWTYAQASGNLAATQGAKTPGQYGPGDGSTTFTLPDLTADGGQFIRPLASGRAIGSSQLDELKNHGHAVNIVDPGHFHNYAEPILGSISVGSNPSSAIITRTASTTGSQITGITATAVAQGGTETRPKNIAYPYIIKT